MRANTKKKHKMGKRFAIVIGVAAVGVMALGAQTGAQTPAPTPPGQVSVTCFNDVAWPSGAAIVVCKFMGTPGNDVITGTPGDDRISVQGRQRHRERRRRQRLHPLRGWQRHRAWRVGRRRPERRGRQRHREWRVGRRLPERRRAAMTP